MKFIFKILLGLVGGIAVLLILATILLPVIYDKEDLKKAISSTVYEQTGRELSIDGTLDFSLFPWLAVEVSDLRLSNADGFGDRPFARIGEARVGIALLPLLRKQISVDEITLDGLDLGLEVDAQGKNNWDDLSEGGEAAATPADESGESTFSAQRIAGLNIRNARVEFRDQQAGEHYLLSGFTLQTGALGDGKPVTLDLTTVLEDLIAGTRAQVNLATTASIDLQAEQYKLEDFEFAVEFGAGDSPAYSTTIRIRAPWVNADLAAQTLAIEPFTVELPELEANGTLSVRSLLDDPAFNGTLSIDSFSPARLMQALQLEAPITADPDVLQLARLSTSFIGDGSQISLQGFELKLDQSQFTGKMDIQNFDQPRITFDFSVDDIDVDRYLEPATDQPVEQEDIAMPQEELRGQNVQGTLRAGKMYLAGVHFSDAELGLSIRNGKLRLNPITANFYGGTYSGDITLDSSAAVPVLSLDEKVDSITFQQLLADLVDNESLSGTAQGYVRLSGRGASSSELTRNLNGDLGLTLNDGALEGINIWYEIRRGLAQFKGLEPPPVEPNRTVFSRMKLAASVKDGIVTTRELIGELPFLTVDGNGTIDLGQSRVDLSLVASIRNAPELGKDPLTADLKGKKFPFRISGPLDDPGFKVDWKALLQSEATGKLMNKLGLSPQEAPADGADNEQEPASSEKQVEDAAKGALFNLLGGKKKDKNKGG